MSDLLVDGHDEDEVHASLHCSTEVYQAIDESVEDSNFFKVAPTAASLRVTQPHIVVRRLAVLGMFAFLSRFFPSEPFLYPYLTDVKGFSPTVVDYYIYGVFPLAYVLALFVTGSVAELLHSYKILIIICETCRLLSRSILIFGIAWWEFSLGQVFYALGVAGELILVILTLDSLPRSHALLGVSFVACCSFASRCLSSALGELWLSNFATQLMPVSGSRLTPLFVISLGSVFLSTLLALCLPWKWESRTPHWYSAYGHRLQTLLPALGAAVQEVAALPWLMLLAAVGGVWLYAENYLLVLLPTGLSTFFGWLIVAGVGGSTLGSGLAALAGIVNASSPLGVGARSPPTLLYLLLAALSTTMAALSLLLVMGTTLVLWWVSTAWLVGLLTLCWALFSFFSGFAVSMSQGRLMQALPHISVEHVPLFYVGCSLVGALLNLGAQIITGLLALSETTWGPAIVLGVMFIVLGSVLLAIGAVISTVGICWMIWKLVSTGQWMQGNKTGMMMEDMVAMQPQNTFDAVLDYYDDQADSTRWTDEAVPMIL